MATESRPRFEVSPELFPQSVRALRDRGLTTTGLSAAAALAVAAAWVAWLLVGSIPVTVRAHAGLPHGSERPEGEAGVPSDASVLASIPSDRAASIRVGQPARVSAGGVPPQPAWVSAIGAPAPGEPHLVRVTVALTQPEAARARLPASGLLDIEIEVGRRRPLALLFDLAGVPRAAESAPSAARASWSR